MRKNNQFGFNVLELIIVMIAIGILAIIYFGDDKEFNKQTNEITPKIEKNTKIHPTETGALAKNRYSDANGYFKIVPPAGWRIQKYPKDPRGKVAFISPDGIELRVLAKGLDHNSFEDMLEEIKGIEKNIQTNTNIEKITFSGKPAVKRTFILKGVKILFIDFMIGNTTHNLMYSTSPTKFGTYLSLAQESMNTYEPTLRGVSPEDVKKHAIAKSLRLSKIFFEQGNYDLALNFIKEGLEVVPNNSNLLELKRKIMEKK